MFWLRKKTKKPTKWWQKDEYFNRLFEEGLEISKTLKRNPDLAPKARFYNLIQFYCSTFSLEGETAEAGCLFGLSSFLMCGYERLKDPSFSGKGHHIFDSFVGLSTPTREDIQKDIENPYINKLLKRKEKGKHRHRSFLEITKKTLSEFPDIQYNIGWIPEVFKNLPDREYRFVHVDVDLYEPTYASFEYFYPRLIKGGVIVCDDYGFVGWPGAKAAVDKYCEALNIPIIRLTTGNAAILKR